MKHRGWKVVFGLSWIPAIFFYGNFIDCYSHMGEESVEGLAGGIGFFLLLGPVIGIAALQTTFAVLAFRG